MHSQPGLTSEVLAVYDHLHIAGLTRSGLLLSALVFTNSAQSGGLLLWSETNGGDLSTAGAGIAARAQDAATVLTNPAGMTRLEGGSEMMVSVGFVYINAPLDSDEDRTTVSGRHGNTDEILPQGSKLYQFDRRYTVERRVDRSGFRTISTFGLLRART